jgi:hypothetical protein
MDIGDWFRGLGRVQNQTSFRAIEIRGEVLLRRPGIRFDFGEGRAIDSADG